MKLKRIKIIGMTGKFFRKGGQTGYTHKHKIIYVCKP